MTLRSSIAGIIYPRCISAVIALKELVHKCRFLCALHPTAPEKGGMVEELGWVELWLEEWCADEQGLVVVESFEVIQPLEGVLHYLFGCSSLP